MAGRRVQRLWPAKTTVQKVEKARQAVENLKRHAALLKKRRIRRGQRPTGVTHGQEKALMDEQEKRKPIVQLRGVAPTAEEAMDLAEPSAETRQAELVAAQQAVLVAKAEKLLELVARLERAVEAAQPFVNAITAFDHDLYLDGSNLRDNEEVAGHGLGGRLTFGKWRKLASAVEDCEP